MVTLDWEQFTVSNDEWKMLCLHQSVSRSIIALSWNQPAFGKGSSQLSSGVITSSLAPNWSQRTGLWETGFHIVTFLKCIVGKVGIWQFGIDLSLDITKHVCGFALLPKLHVS